MKTFDRIILGENCIYTTDCDATGINNNILVAGGSGSGKTMSITEPCLLEAYNSSLIATVTKRRIVNKYKSLFRKRGYDVQDLNFARPGEGDVGYDPLQYVHNDRDIRFLAEAIVMANPRKDKSTNADPYWDDSAVSLLCAEIAYIRDTNPFGTFADVLDLNDALKIKECCGMIETSLDYKFEFLEDKDPSCFAVSCWKTFSQLPVKTASCIFSSLNTTIDTIFSSELRKMIKMQRKVNFEKLATTKTVLFVTTSPVNPALQSFVNMFYGHAFKQLFEFAESLPDGTLPIPVRMICDDFATGSRIVNFTEYISIFREKKISVTLLVQSESQLGAMYGATNATTIINNCDSYVFMGGMDLQTAYNISIRLNVPMDEVLYMPIGQEIVFRRGQKPIVTKRYNILMDELYQKVTSQYEKRKAGIGR